MILLLAVGPCRRRCPIRARRLLPTRICVTAATAVATRLLRRLYNTHDAAEPIALDALVDNDAPRQRPQALHALVVGQAPHAEQIYHVGRAPEAERALGLAAEHDAAAARGAKQVRHVGDEVCAAARVGVEELRVANLKVDTACDSGHARLWSKVKGEVLGEVEGDERHVEGQAGVLKGLRRGRAHGEHVVDGGEGRKAVVWRGGVGEGEGGAVEDVGELCRRR